jgi:hypothetical protein
LIYDHRWLAARFAFDVDHREDRFDLFLVAGAGQCGQTLGVGRIGAERRAGHCGLQHSDGAGGGDRVERVQRDLRRIFRRGAGV